MYMDEEDWRYAPNFPEYVVSNYGEIHRTGQIQGRTPLKEVDESTGDVYVSLMIDGWHERRRFKLDRLVAAAFLTSSVENLMHSDVEHIDGNRENCRADNLRWRD